MKEKEFKKELFLTIGEFVNHVEWFNTHRKQPLEDMVDINFANFAKWLELEVYNSRYGLK